MSKHCPKIKENPTLLKPYLLVLHTVSAQPAVNYLSHGSPFSFRAIESDGVARKGLDSAPAMR